MNKKRISGECNTFCDFNECDENNICSELSISKKRTSSAVETCLNVCESNNCHDNFICKAVSLSLYRTSILNDACTFDCGEGFCFDTDNSYSCRSMENGYIRRTLNDQRCYSSCSGNDCYDSTLICTNPSISNLSPGGGLQCLTSGICPTGKCHIGFVCIAPEINNVADINNRGICLCNENYCRSANDFQCINNQTRMSNLDQSCVSECGPLECKDSKNTCVSLTPTLKRYSSSNHLCVSVCTTGTCRNSDNVCVNVSSSMKRSTNDNEECVEFCPTTACRVNNYICIPSSNTTKRKTLNSLDSLDDLCGEFCASNECFEPNFNCQTVSGINKRKSNVNSNPDSDQCVSNCDPDRCFRNDNICHLLENGFKRSNVSGSSQCVMNCASNMCHSGDFYCVETQINVLGNIIRTSTSNDLCVGNCDGSTCYDSTKTCISVDNSNKRRMSGECNLTCDTEDCDVNNVCQICKPCESLECRNQLKECIPLTLNNKRKSITDVDLCVSVCDDGTCRNSNNICVQVTSLLKRSTVNNEECVSFCPITACRIDENNYTCIPTSNSAKRKTSNLSDPLDDICLTFCPSNECYISSNFNCQYVSGTNKRKTNTNLDANADQCVSTCNTDRCFRNDNICYLLEYEFKRSNVSGSSQCVTNCASNMCHSGDFNCVQTEINVLGNKIRTSISNDSCISNCGSSFCYNTNRVCINVDSMNKKRISGECNTFCDFNECDENNFCLSLSIDKKRTSSAVDTCTNICEFNKCHKGDFICTDVSTTHKRSTSNDECTISCQFAECSDNNICLDLSQNALKRRPISGEICINNCELNQCHVGGICRIVSLNDKRQSDSILLDSCLSYCPTSSCFHETLPIANEGDYVCKSTNNTLNKRQSTNNSDFSNKGDLCISQCSSNMCFSENSNNSCVDLNENGRLRTSNINDLCIDSCLETECYINKICQIPNTGSVKSFLNSKICISACEINACRSDNTFICRIIGDNEIRQALDNDICGDTCKNTYCYDEDKICKLLSDNPALRRKGENLSLSDSECLLNSQCDSNQCQELQICYLLSINKLRMSNSNDICKSTCLTNECFDSFICQLPSEGKISQNDGGQCKLTCSGIQCHENFICVNPTDNTRISNNDGSKCTNSCLDVTKCYESSIFLCQSPSLGKLSRNNGGECFTDCEGTSCYIKENYLDKSPYVCFSPNEIFKSNNNQGECVNSCDSSKCSDNFICVDVNPLRRTSITIDSCKEQCDAQECHQNDYICKPLDLLIRRENNESDNCISFCSSKSCSSNGICIASSENNLREGIEDNKDSCIGNKCSKNSECFHLTEFYCKNPEENFISDNNGSSCKTKCSNESKCYFEFICQDSAFGKLADGDGSNCKAKCTNAELCYLNGDEATGGILGIEDSFKCISVPIGLKRDINSGVCVCQNQIDCLNTNKICTNPTSISSVSWNNYSQCYDISKVTEPDKCVLYTKEGNYIRLNIKDTSLTTKNGTGVYPQMCTCNFKTHCFEYNNEDTEVNCNIPPSGKISRWDQNNCFNLEEGCGNPKSCISVKTNSCSAPVLSSINQGLNGYCNNYSRMLMYFKEEIKLTNFIRKFWIYKIINAPFNISLLSESELLNIYPGLIVNNIYDSKFIFAAFQNGFIGDTSRRYIFNPVITESAKAQYRNNAFMFTILGGRGGNITTPQFPILFDFVKETFCNRYTNPIDNEIYHLKSYKFGVSFSSTETAARNIYNLYKISLINDKSSFFWINSQNQYEGTRNYSKDLITSYFSPEEILSGFSYDEEICP